MATIRIVTPQILCEEEEEEDLEGCGQGRGIPPPTTPPTADEVLALENYVLYFHYQRSLEHEGEEGDLPEGLDTPHVGRRIPYAGHGGSLEELKESENDKGYCKREIKKKSGVVQPELGTSSLPTAYSSPSGFGMTRQRSKKSYVMKPEGFPATQRRAPQIPTRATPGSRKTNVVKNTSDRNHAPHEPPPPPPRLSPSKSDTAGSTVRFAPPPLAAGTAWPRNFSKNQLDRGSERKAEKAKSCEVVAKSQGNEYLEKAKPHHIAKNRENESKQEKVHGRLPQAKPHEIAKSKGHESNLEKVHGRLPQAKPHEIAKNQGNNNNLEKAKPHEIAKNQGNKILEKAKPHEIAKKQENGNDLEKVASHDIIAKNQGNEKCREKAKPNEIGKNQENENSREKSHDIARNPGKEKSGEKVKPHEIAKNQGNENNLEKTTSHGLTRAYSTVRKVPRSLSNLAMDFTWNPSFSDNQGGESYAKKLLKRRFKVTPKRPENPESAPPRFVLKMKSVVLKGMSGAKAGPPADSKAQQAKVRRSATETIIVDDTI